ncbi:MAG TPA: hypothetical protein VIO14_10340 [Dehalococcoidia bacterium]
MRKRWTALLLSLLAAGLLAAACGSGEDVRDLDVQVASYELVAGRENRLMVGLLTPEGDFVSYGSVEMRFSYLGESRAQGEPQPAGEATGAFLPVPGEGAADPPDRPQIGPASQGRGVYAAEPVIFERPGFYQVEVTADLADGGRGRGTAAFRVLAEPQVPAPGQPAIPSRTLTVDSDAPPGAIDSRARTQGRVPDPELHAKSLDQALQEGRPILLVFATPVYCVSQFCGPVTDLAADLQREYGDRVTVIHVEIWHDFDQQQINRAAADWLYRNGNLQEPWFFLIGRDGTILDRWDNLATREDLAAAIQRALGS